MPATPSHIKSHIDAITIRLPDLRNLTALAAEALDDVSLPSSFGGGERVSSSGISRPTERAAFDGRRTFRRKRVTEAAKALEEAIHQLNVARQRLEDAVDT